jgi:hypothetical protein
MIKNTKNIVHDRSDLRIQPNFALRQALAISALSTGLVLTGMAAGKAGEAIADAGYEYSSSTTTYPAQPNDGLDAIASHVDGVENVDLKEVGMHIRSMPQNLEAFADGIQVNELFVIPTHVDK